MPFDGHENLRHRIAQRLREILGPNGEHWCRWDLATPDGKYCIMGAYYVVLGRAEIVQNHCTLIDDYMTRCDDFAEPLRRLGHARVDAPSYNNASIDFARIRALIDAYEECGRVPEDAHAI